MQGKGLKGCRILVTRAKQQFQATADLIEARGGTALSLPCLEIEYLSQYIDEALSQLSPYTDILFSSRNGVEAVAKYSKAPLQTLFQHHRLAAVGDKTALALQAYGIQADIVPDIQSQKGLWNAYETYGLPKSLLFFRAEEGSNFLSNHLQSQGVPVQTVLAYRAICPTNDATPIMQQLKQKQIDAVLLGSAKTAQYYRQRVHDVALANTPILLAMSQQVADAADKLGLNVQLIAKQTSFASMLDELETYFS